MNDYAPLTIDFSEVLQGIDGSDMAIIEARPYALRETGNQLIIDSIEEAPKAPHRGGFLRDSAKVEIEPDGSAALVGFDVPYARRWHEADGDIDPVRGTPINWSEPGVGPRFIDEKLQRNLEKYLAIMGEALRRRIG